MAYAISALALIIGVTVFASKYIVTFGGFNNENKVLLLFRVLYCVAAICALILPIDVCPQWAFPLEDTLPSAFIVALCEIYGVACHSRCSIGTSASAFLYILINADHSQDCGAAFFAICVCGLIAAPVLWVRS